MCCQSRWFDTSVTQNKVIIHHISLLVFLLFSVLSSFKYIISLRYALVCREDVFLSFITTECTAFPRWRVFLYHKLLRLYTTTKLLRLNNFVLAISFKKTWLQQFIWCQYKCTVYVMSKWTLEEMKWRKLPVSSGYFKLLHNWIMTGEFANNCGRYQQTVHSFDEAADVWFNAYYRSDAKGSRL